MRSSAADDLALAAEAFESHVHALFVVDADKRVITHNGAAERLFGSSARLLTDSRAGAACRLVGCHDEGPLAEACVFERALASGGALPEITVDLPSGASAVLVTAAMAGRPSHLLVEMRPADHLPRARRTASGITVVSLGLTQVWSGGSQIGSDWLPQRAGEVLKYLISRRGRPASAEEVAEQIWPDAGPRTARSVRYYVHALRKRLEPFADEPPARSRIVLHEGGRYMLSPRVALDADEFEAAVATGRARFEAGEIDSAVRSLAHAVSLYGGEFLADEPYAEWAIPERDRLRSLAADALRTLTTIYTERSDLDGAAAALERLAELEPFDLDIHRELITLSLRRGRRSAAVRRYESLRRRMLSTFGEDVDFLLSDVAPAE
jgi:DNA-binding SARP family transcriptional activator